MKKLKYVILTCFAAASIFLMDTSAAHAAAVSPIFDASYYFEKNPDVAKSTGNNQELLYQHFLNFGLKEGRNFSMLFDVDAYKKANSDLASAFGNNNLAYYLHFINFGLKENRNGGGAFNATAYLKANPDLATLVGNNPLALYEQFITTGRAEGRKVSAPVINTKKETTKKPSKPSKPSNNNGNHNNKPKPEEKPPVKEPKITVVSIEGDTDDMEFKAILDELILHWEDFEYQDTRTIGEDFFLYTKDFLDAYNTPNNGGGIWNPDITRPTLEKTGILEGFIYISANGKRAEVELKVILSKLEKSESWEKEQTLKEASEAMIIAVESFSDEMVSNYEETKMNAAIKKSVTDDSIQYIDDQIKLDGYNTIRPWFLISKENDPNSPYIFNYLREMNPLELTEEEEALYKIVKSNLEIHATDFNYVPSEESSVSDLFNDWIQKELDTYNLSANVVFGDNRYLKEGKKLIFVSCGVRIFFGPAPSKERIIHVQKAFLPFHGLGENKTHKLPLLQSIPEEIILDSSAAETEAQAETFTTEEAMTEEQSSEETISEEDSTQESNTEENSTQEYTEEDTTNETSTEEISTNEL